MLRKNSRAIGLANEPIGMLPDGTLNVVKIDDPPFEPRVYDDQGVTLLEPAAAVRTRARNDVCAASWRRPKPPVT